MTVISTRQSICRVSSDSAPTALLEQLVELESHCRLGCNPFLSPVQGAKRSSPQDSTLQRIDRGSQSHLPTGSGAGHT